MTDTPKGQVPEALRQIQRYKIGYHSDDWGQRSSTPSVIPDASGSWVRYADHVAALAAGQAVAPAEPTREFLERTLGAMEGVIDVADRKTAEFDALRSCVVDLTLMLFKPATRPAPPAMDGGEDAVKLALTALHSCTTGGYVDVDGDFVRTYHFDKVAVDEAIKALAARAAQKEGETHDPR